MTLKEFINETRWSPNNGIDSARNYSGPDLSDWCQGPSRGRDSEILAESNFDTALEMLGGEQDEIVEVHRFGHWACGWFEIILVNPNNLTAINKLKEIAEALEYYPVLDESDYNDRQYESYQNYAEQDKTSVAQSIINHFGLPEDLADDPDLLEIGYQLHMEAQFQGGEDSCCNFNNQYHYPCERTWEELERLIKDLNYNIKDNPAFEYLKACFDIDAA